MPSTRHLRRRIKSVKSTAQVTKAMQMVASSKMRRAQDAALAGRPYGRMMVRVIGELDHHLGDFSHPLLEKRDVKKRAVLLVSTDRGLCGALNSNLFREAAKLDSASTLFVAAGKKGAQFVARTRRQLGAEFTYRDTPRFAEARVMSKYLQELFLKGEVDAVDVMFNSFVNTLTQTPRTLPLLPVGDLRSLVAGASSGEPAEAGAVEVAEFQFEPDPNRVMGALLPHFVSFSVFQLLLESRASEQSARMVAMKNATDNAGDLIRDLTLEFNKIRQANITKELLEISSAQMALG
jgi:F-type H+-transporting ATPase subunit gamma